MAKQCGFYFDADRCVQGRTCEMACKTVHDLEPGMKWMRVIDIWDGVYPNISRDFFTLACMHCGKPPCIEVCPTGAISKRSEDGIVVVNRDKCNGCQDCFPACPYGVPQFGKDGIMQKCDFCTGLGKAPECAESCPAEALDYGILDKLLKKAKEKGKSARRMEGPTRPSIIIASYIM